MDKRERMIKEGETDRREVESLEQITKIKQLLL